MKPLIAVVALFSTLLPGYAMSQGRLKIIDTITGSGLVALEAALPEIHRAKLKIREYRVSVGEEDSVIYVLCEDPDLPPQVRGSRPSRPGFTVELSKADLRVLKSYYSK